MQRFLKDILNDPPYNLARFANLLLIVCVVLLGSIFLLRTEQKDVTLNLSVGSEKEIMLSGDTQLSELASNKLYPLVELGQDVEKGDALFVGILPEQLYEIYQWIKKLNNSSLIPTKAMLDQYPLPRGVKKKMIDIAKLDVAYKKISNNKLNIEDADRMIRVKEIISQLELDVKELTAAIPKFEALAKGKEDKYFNERERYARKEISIQQLKKEHEKWNEATQDIRTRKNQLKTAKGELYEYKSELSFLANKKPVSPKKEKQNLVPFEQDLARSLDSLIKSQVILSQISGRIQSFGKLDNIQIRDTLIYLEGRMERANRTSTIIANARTADAKHISVNAISNIILKDGSSVQGMIIDFNDGAEGSDSIVRIDIEEEVSYADIEEIIIPAKNSNFIEKVMQNF